MPPAQVTSQRLVPVHDTWQVPEHSTTQLVTLVQAMKLPGPALTPQRSTLWQLYWQLAPQNAPHVVVSWQSMAQLSPHDEEQSFTP